MLRLVAPLIEGNENDEPSAIGAAKPPLRPPMLFCETLIGETPGVKESNCVKLRPLSGRSFTCLVAMTVPNSAVEACSCSLVASTLTTSACAPGARDTSMVAVWFTARTNSETCFVVKLGAVTFKV